MPVDPHNYILRGAPAPCPVLEKRKDRAVRRADREIARRRGWVCPRLRMVGHVMMEEALPEWILPYAITGLTLKENSIWVGLKYVRKVRRWAKEQGVDVMITMTGCRRCKFCQRTLLGMEAEVRYELDRFGGALTRCSPDCGEIGQNRRKAKMGPRIELQQAARSAKR